MPRRPSDAGSTPLYHATVAYKAWVRRELERRTWTLAEFAARIMRADRTARITSAGLSQFFGTLKMPAGPSNTPLMPAMNKVLGIPPPPVCDPTDEIAQLRDRLAERWRKLNARERKSLLALLEDESNGDSSEVTH